MSKKGFEAIALEILWSRLIAITDEMGATLHRTAFSTSAREGKDFTCVLLDAAGELEALTDCVRGIESYLDEYGYDDCSEIMGQALEHIVPMEQLVFHELRAVIVDEEKCLDCDGPCIKRTNARCFALTREGDIPSMNFNQCRGCSLCYWFCPHGAIKMERQ